MGRRPTPLLQVRLYPEPGLSRLYFLALVFPSIAAIRAYLRASPTPLGRHGIAVCRSMLVRDYTRGRYTRTRPIMGEILFPARRLTMEVITHEVTHAALAWADRVGFDPTTTPLIIGRHGRTPRDSAEERFCYGLGRMARQFVLAANRRGLIP